MLNELKNGIHVVGAKQTKRAVNEGKSRVVFLADDADPIVTQPMEALCREKNVPVEVVSTMKELGAVCGIAVGAAVAALLGIWGLVATAAPVGWWSWLAMTLPRDAEAGGGLMVAVIQLAIALGSSIGGLLFDTSGYHSTFIASAIVLLIAAFLTLLTARSPAPHET